VKAYRPLLHSTNPPSKVWVPHQNPYSPACRRQWMSG
jgi:hypothetical protein